MAAPNPADAVLQAQGEQLRAVCGEASVPAGSQAWEALLQFQSPLSPLSPQQLASSPVLQHFCESLGTPGLLCLLSCELQPIAQLSGRARVFGRLRTAAGSWLTSRASLTAAVQPAAARPVATFGLSSGTFMACCDGSHSRCVAPASRPCWCSRGQCCTTRCRRMTQATSASCWRLARPCLTQVRTNSCCSCDSAG